MYALSLEGEIERSGQTHDGIDCQWRRPSKGRNRNTPLRPAIVEPGTLVVDGMCGCRMSGTSYRKMCRNTPRYKQSRQRSESNRDSNSCARPQSVRRNPLPRTQRLLILPLHPRRSHDHTPSMPLSAF